MSASVFISDNKKLTSCLVSRSIMPCTLYPGALCIVQSHWRHSSRTFLTRDFLVIRKFLVILKQTLLIIMYAKSRNSYLLLHFFGQHVRCFKIVSDWVLSKYPICVSMYVFMILVTSRLGRPHSINAYWRCYDVTKFSVNTAYYST